MLGSTRTRNHPAAANSSSRAKQHELSAAYAALAVELTKTDIRSFGGYSLGRIIGEGTFGKVRLGVHRLTGTRVAIKQVPKSLPSYSPNDPSSPLSLLTREIHHHRRLRHPHVLSLYELVATESSIYLVTELCSGGELFDYLVESCAVPAGTGGLALAETRRIFGQLVLGVAYLHSEGVVHRDLKLENVLLDENVNVKIADMGFGREFEKGRWLETKVGTLGYTAPEIVAGQRYLGEQVDIWSLGVILFALLTGSLPFDDDDESVMRSLILSCTYTVPSFLDPDASDLVQRILVSDPLRRPSLRDILAHPFFTRVPGPSNSTSTPLAPPILTGGTAASPSLGEPVTPLGSAFSPSTRSYFAPAPPSPSLDPPTSAIAAGKRRALDPVLSRAPSPASALPAHVLANASPTAAAAPLRRHPSTASIDFGPSAPPVVRTHSSGAGSVHSVSLVPSTSAGGTSSAGGTAKTGKSVAAGSAHAAAAVAPEGDPPAVDYLSLLTSSSLSSPPPLSTPSDEALLAALSAVGFDAGQIAHSVRTSACDACAAAWWMLKRKKEDAARREAREDGTGAATLSRTSSLRSVAPEERRRSLLLVQAEEDELDDEEDEDGMSEMDEEDEDDDEEDVFLTTAAVAAAPVPAPSLVASPDPILAERRPSVASSPSSTLIAPPAPQTPPRRPSTSTTAPGPGTPSTPLADPSPAAAAARLSYFLQQNPTTSPQSQPLLSYFPAVDGAPGSPSKLRGSAGIERSRSREAPGGRSPEKGDAADLQPSPPAEGARRRAGSIGMLARATSAFGQGIASLSSSTGGPSPEAQEGFAAASSQSKASLPTAVDAPAPPSTSTLVATPSLSAPATPQMRHVAGPVLDSVSISADHTPDLAGSPPIPPSSPLPAARPPLPPASSSGSGSGASPARSQTDSAGTYHTTSGSSSTASLGRSSSLRLVPGSGGGGNNKKGLKGANLLSTFKMWFGQSGDPRKRKRASFLAPAAPPLAAGGGGGIGQGGVSRSQSMYVGSPLRRPAMGSRRSSNNSVSSPIGSVGGMGYGPSLSRRSSVSSARGDAAGVGLARTPSRRYAPRPRRTSDASRTSERGIPATPGSALGEGGSRPVSLRSFSGAVGPRRQRHSKAPSGSSAASLVGLSDGGAGAGAVYRRPPTTTTVRRRRGGSHGRHSSDGGAPHHHHHRRTRSSASSAHRSSESDAGGAGVESDFEEEDQVDEGEEPIPEEEEDEPDALSAPAHTSGAGAAYTPSPPRRRPHFARTHSSERASRASSLRSGSPTSVHSRAAGGSAGGSGYGGVATFTAHKTTHLFGSPLQPRAPTSARTRPVRDVFATIARRASGDERAAVEWVDEDDDLAGYGGGLGQPAAGSAAAVATGAGRPSSGGAGAQGLPSVDSPVAAHAWEASAGPNGSGASKFEGRYAGLASGAGAMPSGGPQGRWARPAMVVEEEEEEE